MPGCSGNVFLFGAGVVVYIVLLAICRHTVTSSVVVIIIIVVVSGGVCNCSQMRTSKCTCLTFGVSIGLDPGKKYTKGIFDRSHRWEETFDKTFERKQTCHKQTSFNVQHIYGCRQYGRRFGITRDTSPTISGWLLVNFVFVGPLIPISGHW